jgi:hypothetical protein
MYDDIIDAYVDKVTEHMGSGQRNEVAREMKTHILDSADALAAERKVPVDAVIVGEVIDRMGPAEKIASMYPAKMTILDHDPIKALLSLAGIAFAFLMVLVVLEVVAPDVVNLAMPGSNSSQTVMQVILSVVGALALAIVVIAAIFLCMYIYESRLKTPYEARLKMFERGLHNASSPFVAAAKIIATLFWLVLINVYWPRIPFIQSFTNNDSNATLVPLLSDKFGQFLLYINVFAIAGIVIAVLYVIVAHKWIPSLLEALVSLCTALLFIWILAVFPFNTGLSIGVTALVKVLLAAVVVGCLIGAAKQIWQAIKFALYEKPEKSNAV